MAEVPASVGQWLCLCLLLDLGCQSRWVGDRVLLLWDDLDVASQGDWALASQTEQ